MIPLGEKAPSVSIAIKKGPKLPLSLQPLMMGLGCEYLCAHKTFMTALI